VILNCLCIVRLPILFLFLLLETLAFYMVFTQSNFHNTGFFNSSNYITGNIYKSYDDVTDYFNLKNSNLLLPA
jgi:rod shape-determining protein MreC